MSCRFAFYLHPLENTKIDHGTLDQRLKPSLAVGSLAQILLSLVDHCGTTSCSHFVNKYVVAAFINDDRRNWIGAA